MKALPGLARLPQFGKPAKRLPKPQRGKQIRKPAPPNYAKIKEEVTAAIARLAPDKRALIPATGTLPEIMVCLGLVWAGYSFQAQNSELGGRLRLGGAVVDMKVWLGNGITLLRVMGDYWHSMPDRKLKDAVQWSRLHALRYRVADLWEHDIYQAWVDGRLKEFVEQATLNAA